MDKFIRNFYIDKRIFVFLLGIMIIGVLFGSSLPLFLSAEDKGLVSSYLYNFVSSIDSYDSLLLFKNGLIGNGLFLFFIWILGISIIGVPIVIFMFFSKCFVFGFSISSIIFNYGFKGILFSFFYIFPHCVIELCIYGLITNFSLFFSIKILGMLFKKHDFNIRSYFVIYLKYFCIFIFIFLLCLAYESFISPIILSFVVKFLGI